MSIGVRYTIYCTNCRRESTSCPEETKQDAWNNAMNEGWSRYRMPNGSIWEICRKCLCDFLEYENCDNIPID